MSHFRFQVSSSRLHDVTENVVNIEIQRGKYLCREGGCVTAYRGLDMLHHRKVTSCPGSFWLHVYYTGNAGIPQNNLIAIKSDWFVSQPHTFDAIV